MNPLANTEVNRLVMEIFGTLIDGKLLVGLKITSI